MSVWDNFMKCFKHGGKAKGCVQVKLSDLYTRVPPNQRKQFQEFATKSEQYRIRLHKYPARLPVIDWDYYKQNVRGDYVSWVDDFKKKYDNLDTVFGDRHTVIDHTKYFGDLVKETEIVTKSVEEFKKESNDRIKCLEFKMDYLKNLKSYSDMTMEEYCFAHPDSAPDFINKPTFWPHTEDEQKPGPKEVHMPDADDEEKPKPKDPKSKGDKSTPPGTPPSTPPATPPATPPTKATPAEPKKEIKAAAPPKDEKPKAAVAKVEKNAEGQAVEMISQYAAKGLELAKDLAAKVCVMIQGLYQKAGEKRKEVTETANAERQKIRTEAAAKKPKDRDDDDLAREGSPSICHKTIIRGDDTAKADVKEHHTNLDIESDDECREQRKERKQCKQKERENICDVKPKKCLKLNKKEDDGATKCQAQNIEYKMSSIETREDPVVGKSPYEFQLLDLKKDKIVLQPQETSSPVILGGTLPLLKLEPFQDAGSKPVNEQGSIKLTESTEIKNEKIFGSSESDSQNESDPIQPGTIKDKAKYIEPTGMDNTGNRIFELSELKTIDQMRAERVKIEQDTPVYKSVKKPLDTSTFTIRPSKSSVIRSKKEHGDEATESSQVEMGAKVDAPNESAKESESIGSDEMAKQMFKMATTAATLLSQARKIMQETKESKRDNVVDLARTYEAAEDQVARALSEAYKALSAAKQLTKRAEANVESGNKKAVLLIEKHATLAKLLAQRALTMKKEITKILNGLKKNN